MATVSPHWAYTLQLPHDPRAPGIARATLRTVLAAHDLTTLTPTAELLASELLTNAHLHTRGPYALRLLSAEPDRLTVAVWDTDPRVPPGYGEADTPVPPASARLRPQKIGLVNAANAPGTGPAAVSWRSSARTYAAYCAVVLHSTVPEPETGKGALVKRTPWSVTRRTVQRGRRWLPGGR